MFFVPFQKKGHLGSLTVANWGRTGCLSILNTFKLKKGLQIRHFFTTQENNTVMTSVKCCQLVSVWSLRSSLPLQPCLPLAHLYAVLQGWLGTTIVAILNLGRAVGPRRQVNVEVCARHRYNGPGHLFMWRHPWLSHTVLITSLADHNTFPRLRRRRCDCCEPGTIAHRPLQCRERGNAMSTIRLQPGSDQR